jgi:sulfate transport system ATP-binding protein
MSIAVRNIVKTYGNFKAVRDVSLEIDTGELVALLGPSGSGKTSLLRIIAGLDAPDRGSVLLHDQDATGHSAAERRVGFVFQHYALFRHLTVFENVAFGLEVQRRRVRLPKLEIKQRVQELLELVQLQSHARMYPSQLSGGQRQRVALARALAVEPKVLLLDEPFGALDANVRKELRRWLRRLHDELHVTSVLVTHDQEEALEVADRVAIMNNGSIEQVGSPEEVYDRPANPFVYKFLGNVNLFHQRATADHLSANYFERDTKPSQPQSVGYVRPHDLEISRSLRLDHAGVEAEVLEVYAAGPLARVELRRRDTGDLIEAEISRQRHQTLSLQPGETVYVTPLAVHLFSNTA